MFKNCKPHPLSFLTLLHPFLKNNSLHFFFFVRFIYFRENMGMGGRAEGEEERSRLLSRALCGGGLNLRILRS